MSLPTRVLGRTGYQVTTLGIGGWLGILDDPRAARAEKERAGIDTVRRAVDLGITYFDTSPSYGGGTQAQCHLGLGLKELSAQERATLRVATKTGTHPDRLHQYDADSTRWTVDQNLAALFTDHVDVLLAHDPRNDADMDAIMAPGGALEALEQLKAQRVIGAIGLGVRTHKFLRRAIESDRFDVIITPYDYTLLRTSAAPIIQLAAARNVGVINGSPYAAGLIAGLNPDDASLRRRPLTPADMTRARALWHWSVSHQLDLGALAMQYSLRNPLIATTLAGPRTPEEVEGNVAHALADIPGAIWQELDVFLGTLPPPGPGGEVDP